MTVAFRYEEEMSLVLDKSAKEAIIQAKFYGMVSELAMLILKK